LKKSRRGCRIPAGLFDHCEGGRIRLHRFDPEAFALKQRHYTERFVMSIRLPTNRLAGLAAIATMPGIGLVMSLNAASAVPVQASEGAAPKVGPTAGNALEAEQDIARAMRDNDGAVLERMLADDWIVIATTGGVAEGKSTFPDGIKSGYLTRKTFELSEPRVRLYGNVALITTKVKLSGIFKGKSFDVMERQTDVLHWEHGGWKSVLTHETKISP
jgi:ketosteroid isomerase-like protein